MQRLWSFGVGWGLRKCAVCGNGGGPSCDNARGAGIAAPAGSAAAKLLFRVATGVSVRGCPAVREGYE